MEAKHFLSSSPSTQSNLYLWFREPDDGYSRNRRLKSIWYKLDLAQLHLPESELTLVSKPDLNETSTAVASESTIYVLAGISNYDISIATREVYYLDTRRPDLGWKIGPALNFPRTNRASVYVKDGKICVSGGVESKPRGEKVNKDQMEFLDPLLNTWSLVKEHSYLSEREPKDEDYVLFSFGNWKGNVYCWSSMLQLGEEVMCLDRKGLNLPWNENDNVIVVEVGDGRWCLLWESCNGLHCTKFRVSVHSDGEGEVAIIATIEAFRVFSDYEPMMDEEYLRLLKDCLVLPVVSM